ncbi:type II toxin-antitoxin system RelN family antitoxin [Nostoc sp.]
MTDKNSRVEVIVLIPEEEILNDQSQAEVLADFRQAWHEAMTGQTIPVAQLWEGLEND